MSHIGSVAHQTGLDQVRPRTLMDRMTRVGFLCKGVVYLLVGVLALLAALHEGGETTDQRGVIQRVAEQPFGALALVVIAAGLLAYALWRFLCAIKDCEGEGTDASGVGKRIGYFLSGAVYAGLAFYAIKLLNGNPGGSGDPAKSWTARLLDVPAGPLLVMLIGIAVIVWGAYQLRHGLSGRFRDKLRLGTLSSSARLWVVRLGTWGYAARAVIFGIMGAALISAGLNTNPGKAKGLEATLDAMASKSYGDLLLAFVAAGLACYGVFSIIEARYRRVPQ